MSAATAASSASGSAPVVSPCGPPSACPIGADSLSFLSAYARSQRFATGQPSGFAVASQGERVYFLRTEGEGAVTQNLYEASQTVRQADRRAAVGGTDREGTSTLLLACDSGLLQRGADRAPRCRLSVISHPPLLLIRAVF